MDTVRFSLNDHHQIDVFVNGVSLVDIVRPIEVHFVKAEGSNPHIAGMYRGLLVNQLRGSVAAHFLGGVESHLCSGPREKTVLLTCLTCGESGCWALMARVRVDNERVSWSEFEHPRRSLDGQRLSAGRAAARVIEVLRPNRPPVRDVVRTMVFWNHDALHFEFERNQYEAALQPIIWRRRREAES